MQHRASVRIVLFNSANPRQFIALSEVDDPNNIKLPGGTLEKNEMPDDAAARELLEELGVTPEQVALIPVGELLNDNGVSRRYIYVGKVISSVLHPSSEIHHIELLTLETVPAGENQSHIASAVTLARTASGISHGY